jgi:hypothetical protein
MLFAICEQHVIAVDHRGEEMAFLAGLPLPVLALFGLNHGRCGVGRDHTAFFERCLPHGMNNGRTERAAGFFDVAAHHAAIELNALIGDVLLEPIVRHAERELLHEDVRDY